MFGRKAFLTHRFEMMKTAPEQTKANTTPARGPHVFGPTVQDL